MAFGELLGVAYSFGTKLVSMCETDQSGRSLRPFKHTAGRYLTYQVAVVQTPGQGVYTRNAPPLERY